MVAFIGEAGGKDTDFRVAVEGKIGGSVEVGFIGVLNGFGEDGAEVTEGLFGLFADTARYKVARSRVETQLTGHKQQVARLYSLTVGPNGRGRLVGCNYSFHFSIGLGMNLCLVDGTNHSVHLLVGEGRIHR